MLETLFDEEKPLMKALSVIADLLIVNLLSVACALPVFTAGASMIALNDVIYKVVRKEEPYIIKRFFLSLRSNFLRGLFIIIPSILFAAIIGFEWWGIRTYFSINLWLIGMTILVLAVFWVVLQYTLALSARYDNTMGRTIQNAATLALGYFPRSVAMLVIWVGWILFNVRFCTIFLPVGLMFAVSLPTYLCALLYDPIFKKLEGEETNDNDEK